MYLETELDIMRQLRLLGLKGDKLSFLKFELKIYRVLDLKRMTKHLTGQFHAFKLIK